MALVKLDPYDQPTRATAGTVIYRNGPVQTAMRSRSYPTVPKHLTRNPSLNAITILSERWELLSNAQRIGWGNYAYASPLIDAWGNDRFIRGYAHYMRSNRPRVTSNITPIDDPPTTPGFPTFGPVAVAYNTTDQRYEIAWPTTDPWWREFDANLYVWISKPRPTSRQRPPETYALADVIYGNPFNYWPHDYIYAHPPLDAPSSIQWIRLAVGRADGRYTSQ